VGHNYPFLIFYLGKRRRREPLRGEGESDKKKTFHISIDFLSNSVEKKKKKKGEKVPKGNEERDGKTKHFYFSDLIEIYKQKRRKSLRPKPGLSRVQRALSQFPFRVRSGKERKKKKK